MGNVSQYIEQTRIASGTYVGNDTANRAIPHTLGKVPKWVFLHKGNGGAGPLSIGGEGFLVVTSASGQYMVTAADTTNFYVGNAGSYTNSGNSTGVTWTWVAIG